MISDAKLIEIYYLIDEFNKEFDTIISGHQLEAGGLKKRKKRPYRMNNSEIMTILVIFHLSGYRNLKHFYINHVQKHMKNNFPETVSYNRFVELQSKTLINMVLFLKTMRSGEITGISFVDSTPIRVCKNKRIHNHKVFKGIATTGKSTMGWFHGFKLHIIVNDKGEIINFVITQANVDDRTPLKDKRFTDKLWGKLFADKGYISKDLFNKLFVDDIQLITGIRNNMKNQLMTMFDKITLRKRSIIETINDELKNICQIEHSRHRSFFNFVSNLISGLIAYSFLPKKPRIKYDTYQTYGQLAIY